MGRDPNPGSGFDLRGLPDLVKSLGLPDVAVGSIDRYWKPEWDRFEDELPLLPVHSERTPPPGPEAAAAQRLYFEAVDEPEPGAKCGGRPST
jgi:hypothetical protein